MERLHPQLSSPAKAGDPVRRGLSVLSLASLGSGSPAFAGDDSGGMTHLRILATHCARGLQVIFATSLKSEGAGNAGCALHPRSRVQIVESCAHEHTGQRRQSDIPCAMALRLITRSPR